MTAMTLARPDFPPWQQPTRPTVAAGRENDQSDIFPADARTAAGAPFRPLDPGIVNETIPAFFIGRNKEGFWVARDVNGRMGGIFLLENSALSFARRNCRPAGCATIYLSERFELDLENAGNPLAQQLGSLNRLASRSRTKLSALVASLTKRLRTGRRPAVER
jgi:hypothetical protein